MGVSGCSGREWVAHTVYARPLRYQRESTSQWHSVVCAKPMRDAVVHGNVAPRRDYAMAISAVQSAAHHARRDGIRPSLPSSGLFRRNGQVSVETNEEEPRRRYARSRISLLSLPAPLLYLWKEPSLTPQCQLFMASINIVGSCPSCSLPGPVRCHGPDAQPAAHHGSILS